MHMVGVMAEDAVTYHELSAGRTDPRGAYGGQVAGPRAAPQALAEVDRWPEPCRVLWPRRLDALERHLEENP
ncbi:hypothetical protein GCM10022224_005830 [Nonomuraea antimicrobica]|uniref:Uncharacterized protein n=1 Tax=Nonomuraea antimicrobica TaxID=561173 RepID=A0ABP7B2Q2_9ACTN